MLSKHKNVISIHQAFLASILMTRISYHSEKKSHLFQKLSFKLDKYKKTLEEFVNDLMSGKETPLTTQAKSQGNKVASEAKNYKEAVELWLKWGRQNNYLKK